MKITLTVLLLLWGRLGGAAAATTRPRPRPPRDHDDGGDDDDDALERLLLSVPDPSALRSDLYDLTRIDHVAGTPGDYADAGYVLDRFRSLGFDARVEEVPVMLTSPRRAARLSASNGYEARLSEDALDFDSTSGTSAWRNLTFLAYAPGGTVSAPLVYANYGRPEDFDSLDSLGVSVAGRIVIMRYGECFRGLKVMNAESRGAVGTIIYSDPQQDGDARGPVYPDGPWRPPSGVQRGSVQFNTRCAGDPFRLYSDRSVRDLCGYGASELIPSRPALPVSYGDAAPLLGAMGGPPAPAEFAGGLPLNYTVGPSSFDATLSTDAEFREGRIPNVIATIPGADPAAGSVVLGNHRDAWVYGAADPNSGTAALLEVARALAALTDRMGWRPRRSVHLASWSGEEYGMLGSTAFAEMHPEIVGGAVAYLNVDIAVRGNASLEAAATHSLDELFREAAGAVPAPDAVGSLGGEVGGATMADRWVGISGTDGWGPPPSGMIPPGKMGTLGSGSDYVAFLDRFGVPSLDMTFAGDYGVYHSIYDSFDWMDSYGDPTYRVHQAMARLWALMAFRLASREVLPFRMTTQAEYMLGYLSDMSKAAKKADVDLTELKGSAMDFYRAAVEADAEARALTEPPAMSGEGIAGPPGEPSPTAKTAVRGGSGPDRSGGVSRTAAAVSDLNRRLSHTERRFLGPGLPRRPWFRHVLQAPGYYMGYGSRAFPGIAEAVDAGDAALAQSEVAAAAGAVSGAAAFLSGGGGGGDSVDGARDPPADA